MMANRNVNQFSSYIASQLWNIRNFSLSVHVQIHCGNTLSDHDCAHTYGFGHSKDERRIRFEVVIWFALLHAAKLCSIFIGLTFIIMQKLNGIRCVSLCKCVGRELLRYLLATDGIDSDIKRALHHQRCLDFSEF